jgi:CRP-like cAMP-binding protein
VIPGEARIGVHVEATRVPRHASRRRIDRITRRAAVYAGKHPDKKHPGEERPHVFIAQSELFKGLSEQALQALTGRGVERSYEKGDPVFREGDEAKTFHILKHGSVELVMGTQEELCFTVSMPGQVFGWSALVEPHRYRATARCTSPAQTGEIGREVVDTVVDQYEGVGAIIFRNLSTIVTEKLRRVYEERISDADLAGVFFSTDEGLHRLRAFDDAEIQRLQTIVMDKDSQGALQFLTHVIRDRIKDKDSKACGPKAV